MKTRLYRCSALLTGSLLLALLAVPVVLTWRAWRQQKLDRALIVAVEANNVKEVIRILQQAGATQ